jgi:hypothetical protein
METPGKRILNQLRRQDKTKQRKAKALERSKTHGGSVAEDSRALHDSSGASKRLNQQRTKLKRLSEPKPKCPGGGNQAISRCPRTEPHPSDPNLVCPWEAPPRPAILAALGLRRATNTSWTCSREAAKSVKVKSSGVISNGCLQVNNANEYVESQGLWRAFHSAGGRG